MKILHIEGVSKEIFTLPAAALKMLQSHDGKDIGLCTTIQFIGSIANIKSQLEKAGKRVILLQGRHSAEKGQILGCDVPKLAEGIDFVLFIGDGMFHPKALFLKNHLPVFAYNPFAKQLSEISQKDVDMFVKRRKGAILKFNASKSIGIIVSLKPGQRVSEKILKSLEEEYADKIFYKFVADTIDFSQLENFPFIECWVNTACPRIAYDDAGMIGKAIINIDDLN